MRELVIPLLKLPLILLRGIWALLGQLYERLISKLRFSITFRMTSTYVFIITLTLLFLSMGIIGSGLAYVLKSEGDDLQREFLQVKAFMEGQQAVPEQQIGQLAALYGISISVFDPNQQLLFTTEQKPEDIIFINPSKSDNIIVEYSSGNQMLIGKTSEPGGSIPEAMLNGYGYALVLNDKIGEGEAARYIQIVDRLSEETEYGIIFVIALGIFNVFFVVIISIVGRMASKKLLRPLKTMTEAAQNVTINQLDKRLDVRGSQNELKDLAKTFNSMLDRLQHSYEMQNQFVSDASHELRTPISIIQGYANLLDRWGKEDKKVMEESIAAIKMESEDMKNLIEKLLFLARGDKDTQKIEKQDFQINELIDEIIKETKLIDGIHQIANTRNEPAVLFADRSLIKEAIRVFVDNSVKYTPEGGMISLQCYPQNANIVIQVEDTGVGIPKEDLPHVFDRFYRADKSRTKNTGGTGLGMAIAKWIIVKHGGSVQVQSELNIGTRISMTIPANKK